MEISHEQYVSTFNSLPIGVRSFIVDGSVAPVVQDLGRTYSLHVDVIGKLEEQATYMLMGLTSPAEVLGMLVLADVPSDVAKAILQELNIRIFIPLQKHMRENPSEGEPEGAKQVEVQQSTPMFESARPKTPPAAPQVPVPSLVSTQNLQTAEPVSAAPVANPQNLYVKPDSPALQVPTSINNPAPVPPPVMTQPAVRTMAQDMEYAQGHELTQPSPVYQNQPSIQDVPQPAPTSVPSSVPQSPPAPAQQASTQTYPPPAMAPVRLTPVDRMHTGAPITKEYGSDPYREPIE